MRFLTSGVPLYGGRVGGGPAATRVLLERNDRFVSTSERERERGSARERERERKRERERERERERAKEREKERERERERERTGHYSNTMTGSSDPSRTPKP